MRCADFLCILNLWCLRFYLVSSSIGGCNPGCSQKTAGQSFGRRMNGSAGSKVYKRHGGLCLPCKWVMEKPKRLRRDWPCWAEWHQTTAENWNKKRKRGRVGRRRGVQHGVSSPTPRTDRCAFCARSITWQCSILRGAVAHWFCLVGTMCCRFTGTIEKLSGHKRSSYH